MNDLEEYVKQLKDENGAWLKPLYPIADVRGMTGESIRQLLNYRVSQARVYLEAGLYCGLSFTSAMYENEKLERAIAIDSWAEFTDKGRINPRNEFLAAVKKYYPPNVPLTLIEQDHWTVKGLPEVPDLFYYDGDHSELSQQRALSHFGPMCAGEFFYCVDDWNWDRVRRGTLKGLSNFTIIDGWEKFTTSGSDSEFWNGFAMFKLKQK